MNFYLIRHGQTAWNAQHKVMGRTDVPLDAIGEQQVEETAELMKTYEIDQIFSSPQLRAQQTAQKIAIPHKLPVNTDERLCEMDFPRWVGKMGDALVKDEIYIARKKDIVNFSHPEVESLKSLMERTKIFLSECEKKGGNIAIVTHLDVVRAFLLHMLNEPHEKFYQFMIQNASCTILKKQDSGWILELMNYSKDPTKKLNI